MENTSKVFLVKNELYLVSDEKVVIGDTAIVTVSDEFPTLVECQNDFQIKLFQEPTLSSTKRYKVLKNLTESQPELKEYFEDRDGFILVNVQDGKITFKETKE